MSISKLAKLLGRSRSAKRKDSHYAAHWRPRSVRAHLGRTCVRILWNLTVPICVAAVLGAMLMRIFRLGHS